MAKTKLPKTTKQWLALIRKLCRADKCCFRAHGQVLRGKSARMFLGVPYIKCDRPGGGTMEVPLTNVDRFLDPAQQGGA